MKTLHQFMFDKRLHLTLGVDTNPPSTRLVAVKTTEGDPIRYALLSLPPYPLRRLPELLGGDAAGA